MTQVVWQPNPLRAHEGPKVELPIDVGKAREATEAWLTECVSTYNRNHPGGPEALYLFFASTGTFVYLQPQQTAQTMKLTRSGAGTTALVFGVETSSDEMTPRISAGLLLFLGFVAQRVAAGILHHAQRGTSAPTVS